MGESDNGNSACENTANKHAKEDNGDEDTLIRDLPPANNLGRASGAAALSNKVLSCEESSDGSVDGDSSSYDSSDDELYSRDSVPDLDRAREILQAWHFLPKLVDYDSDEEEPPRPKSPLFEPSEEYKSIQASAIARLKKLEASLADAHLHRVEYAKLKRRDYSHLIKGKVKVKDFASSRPKSPSPRLTSSLHDARCVYNTCSTENTTPRGKRDSFGEDDASRERKVHFQLPPPPQHLVELLDKAEKELLADISKLRHDKENVIKMQAVTDKYFPSSVYKKMQVWPELVKGYNAIHDLECEAMRERLDPVIMMARVDPVPQDAGGQDEDRAGDGAAPQQHNGYASGSQSPGALDLEQAPLLPPRSRASSPLTATEPSLRASPMHRAFDRLLAVGGPATPNASPALSNDAGETLGNLRELTERLKIASHGMDSTGIVPQSRFASPAYWQESATLQRQYEEMRAEPFPMTQDSGPVYTDGSFDVPPDARPQLVHPQPLRPAEHASTILDRPSGTPSVHRDTSPRARTPSQLGSTPDTERINGNVAGKKRKRNKSESDANDERADAKFRERYDSIWDRKGHGDDRKGSGGSSGAVAG
ncbi:hypothetical protein DE146DRAFT_636047 [Phaeosphaeria sp. MPI-PUGE-AT-0046c]|nr:hypothetical protein DE146DRAFT_636047 [Phaeosphaeria sp. MPI-PUGE-AT-0046c]